MTCRKGELSKGLCNHISLLQCMSVFHQPMIEAVAGLSDVHFGASISLNGKGLERKVVPSHEHNHSKQVLIKGKER